MRDAFRDTLYLLMKDHKDIIFLTADLGFGVFNKIEEEFPERYINVGVAEQNMIGLATGLGLAGFRVVAYSIGNFASLRCLEQIRNDACYHKCNITIVSSGAGFTYGQLGMSHHAIEDVAVIKAIPDIQICTPSTPKAAQLATIKFLEAQSVKYLRLDKSSFEIYHDLGCSIEKLNFINCGQKVCILTHGSILSNVLLGLDDLKRRNISPSIIDVNIIKPLDEEISNELEKYEYVVTIEELSEVGGLGSSVADIIATNKRLKANLLKIAIPNNFISVVGDQNYLREKCGLDPYSIVQKIINFIGSKS